MIFRVKFRNLEPAKRNPFRPSQKIKRGKWIADQTYYGLSEWPKAKARCEMMNKGFREAAVFIGNQIIRPNEYTGKLPDWPPGAGPPPNPAEDAKIAQAVKELNAQLLKSPIPPGGRNVSIAERLAAIPKDTSDGKA